MEIYLIGFELKIINMDNDNNGPSYSPRLLIFFMVKDMFGTTCSFYVSHLPANIGWLVGCSNMLRLARVDGKIFTKK